MNKIISAIVVITSMMVQSPTHAQSQVSRVDQSVAATEEKRTAQTKSLDEKLAKALFDLEKLETELRKAEESAGLSFPRFIKKVTLFTAAVSVVAVIHGLGTIDSWGTAEASLPLGLMGLAASGLGYMGAAIAEVKLTSAQTKILQGQVMIAKQELNSIREALAREPRQ